MTSVSWQWTLCAVAIALLSCAHHVVAAEYSRPVRALLALHREMDGDLVASKNVTVTYHVHNVGLTAAQQVALKDLSFPASRFLTFGDKPRRTWSSISPGESRLLQLVVSPLKAGQLIVAPASVSYMDEGTQRTTRLATDDTLKVEDLLSYKRRTDRHVLEWSLYAAAFVLLCVVPFAISLVLEKSLSQSSSKKNN